MGDSDVQDALNDIGRGLGIYDDDDQEQEPCGIETVLDTIAVLVAERREAATTLKVATAKMADVTAQNQARGKEIERLNAEIAKLKAELGLHAWGPDAPAPESITYAECKVDGVRFVRLYRGDVEKMTCNGEKAMLTRFVRDEGIERLKAEAAKDAEIIAELAREIEGSHADAPNLCDFGLRKVNGRWEREQ